MELQHNLFHTPFNEISMDVELQKNLPTSFFSNIFWLAEDRPIAIACLQATKKLLLNFIPFRKCLGCKFAIMFCDVFEVFFCNPPPLLLVLWVKYIP
jgi:hypothetical protein